VLTLDHLAVSAETLAAGVAAVEQALGVTMAHGGQHPQMGTHNRLLGLGDLYLEVIAVDPAAKPPSRPRWFDLDRFSGPPRLTNWVARSTDLAADLAANPPGSGVAMALQRGDYHWQMTVPADGRLPFDGGFAALIQWQGALHPTHRLPDCGVRLLAFEIAHPQAAALKAALAGRLDDPRLSVREGPLHLSARFATPNGLRQLG